jgi:hypothetical protein
LSFRQCGQHTTACLSTMKQLTWKLIIPLTVISFTVFTKWWYVLAVDAPDTMMIGFPLPYFCNGWHTSLSLQIFLTELFINLLTYLSFWFVVIFSIEKFLTKINLSKVVTLLLISTAGLCICGLTLFALNPDNLFYIKRPFDIEVLKTGYKFVWEVNPRPEK